MPRRRRLQLLSEVELSRLTRTRLRAYRDSALSLEESPARSDLTVAELAALDPRYVWFKSDPRWQPHYQRIESLLTQRAEA